MKKDGSFIRNSVGFSHHQIKRMEFGCGIRIRDGCGPRKAFGPIFSNINPRTGFISPHPEMGDLSFMITPLLLTSDLITSPLKKQSKTFVCEEV
jgi:hypothetical protein